jgi:hypothetical protein
MLILFLNNAKLCHPLMDPFCPQIFPPEDWLIASSVPSKFSPDAIQNILNELTPETVR